MWNLRRSRSVLSVVGLVISIACSIPSRAGEGSSSDAERSSEAILGSSFQDRYATINGVRLHYVIGGKGPPLLAVPGWPETWLAWRRVMPALSEKFTVIAVDIRGMGGSDRPKAGYDMNSVEGDLLGLMRKLGYSRFRLVGHDIGVWISYAIAVDHREAVDRVAMIDSNIPGVTEPVPIFLPKTDNTHSWHFMFNQLDDLPETLTRGRERQFLSWIYSNYAFKPQALAIDDYVRAYSAPGAMSAGFAYYRALPATIEQNHQRSLKRLTMPVLALGGVHGTADKAETTLRPYADNLRGAVLPDCGHYVPEECPDALIAQLLPFLTAEGDGTPKENSSGK